MPGPCLCRANCFDGNYGQSDVQIYLLDAIMTRGGQLGADNTGHCNWPRCYRGDPHPSVKEGRSQPVEWR